MKNTILCSDSMHPIWPLLAEYAGRNGMLLTSNPERCVGGEYLFLVSCTEILGAEVRRRYDHVLVVHESDLPAGRGWSPLAHQVLDGRNNIVIALVEAADRVDSGRIWRKATLRLEGHELADEIAEKSFRVKAGLMDWALVYDPEPVEQCGGASYYPRRTPEDCRLDPDRSIGEQFNLLRICEPRYPAFFELRGHRYLVSVRKA